MSLVRLLTAGKAFTTLRDLPSSYRMRREALLPKFGTNRNPFTPEESPPAATAAPRTVTVAASEAKPRRGEWLRRWLRFVTDRPGKETNRRQLLLKTGPTRRHRIPVQGELSLSNVKVVRNDLTDSDVDVVARGNGAAATRLPAASHLLVGAMAAGRVLDRLAERIVGNGSH